MRYWMGTVMVGAALAGSGLASELSTTAKSREGEEWWKNRFAERKAQAEKGECPFVFMGDSITHGWDGRLDKHFPDMKIVNISFGGDRTEQTVWVVENLDWKKINAKVIMLMIGTNNTGHRNRQEEKPEDTFEGIKTVIQKLGEKTPDTKVLLLAIFPRGATAADEGRVRNSIANAMVPTLADNKRVFFMDIGARFLDTDGATLPKDIMGDALHPGDKGYAIWADAVKAKLEELAK